MRVVALTPYPLHAPSTRFRLGQFVAPLASQGIHLRILPFFSSGESKAFSTPGGRVRKTNLLLKGLRRRARQIDLAERADLALVQRELAPVVTGPLLARLRSADLPLVYDFDDAVFLPPRGGSRMLGRLRSPRTAALALCECADLVLAGNGYLADFATKARKVARGVQLLPTVIDTDRHRATRGPGPTSPLVIGWIGTGATLPYLEAAFPLLRQLAARIPFQLLVVADREPKPAPGLNLSYLPWSEKAEETALRKMHVGIDPLPKDRWTLGKCGSKAIHYMAHGLPVVASPVGVLKDIVVHEETGLHAENEDGWVEALGRLLTDPGARDRFGSAGRERVVSRYSLQSVLPDLVTWLEDCRRRKLEGKG